MQTMCTWSVQAHFSSYRQTYNTLTNADDKSEIWLIDDRLYSAILRSLEQTHCAHMWFYMSD